MNRGAFEIMPEGKFSYKAAGVDRKSREKLRHSIGANLRDQKYRLGKILELPFQKLFQTGEGSKNYFDFQIEGVGTKTLLAELDDNYGTIGIDGVAMVANDIARSGAQTVLLSDAIHIAKSKNDVINQLLDGVKEGARLCGAVLASGETGDVGEILHRSNKEDSPSFDLIVSAMGMVESKSVIHGDIRPGDAILGAESSGIHSNGLTLARKILLKNWGGYYDPYDMPDGLDQPVVRELLKPTRIYAKAIPEVTKEIKIKAALHVTGDGFAKFARFAEFRQGKKERSAKRIGFELDGLMQMPELFNLIKRTAQRIGKSLSFREMFMTFNMGVGFAVIVESKDAERALDHLNRFFPTLWIGHVTNQPGVVVKHFDSYPKKIIL
jgi:phosphoribosylformylglycinamidine cyclo-ligase